MAESIQDTVDRLTAFIEQNYTDIDAGPGSVISELLIKLAATLHNEQYNLINTLSQGRAFSTALNSEQITFSPIIDELASNYNTYRSTGVKVQGKVKVYVASNNYYSILKGYVFNQPSLGLKYFTVDKIRVSPKPAEGELQLFNSSTVDDSGRVVQEEYYFIIDVLAETEGPEYQLASGSPLDISLANYVLKDFIKAEAYGNFTTGASPESDRELVEKIKSNLGNQRFESALGIANRLRQQFTGFQYLSVCGANDAEMVRSKQNILGISTFGKADIYVRSSLGPEVKKIVKTANLVSGDIWQVEIKNTDVPGFYYIQSILPKSKEQQNIGGTLPIVSSNFDVQFYDGQRNNDIPSALDARFTKYQSAVIRFRYTEAKGATQAVFELSVVYQPNILEMQDLLLSDYERLACADYLVKAVLPCTVSLKLKLASKRTTDTYDTLALNNLKKDIFKYVNSIPLGQELYASSIIDICHNYDIRRVDLPIEMRGNIFCVDGSVIALEDSDVLQIPTVLSKGVSPKTTAYFIDYYRVESGVANSVDNIGISLG